MPQMLLSPTGCSPSLTHLTPERARALLATQTPGPLMVQSNLPSCCCWAALRGRDLLPYSTAWGFPALQLAGVPTPQPGGLHSSAWGGFPFHSLGVPSAQPGRVLCMCISHLVWVLMGGHPVLDLSRPLTTPELSRQPGWVLPVH